MKKGFTLIEVLIVVLILGILATFSIPQFSVMQKKARIAQLLADVNILKRGVEFLVLEGSLPTSGIPSQLASSFCNTYGIDAPADNEYFTYKVFKFLNSAVYIYVYIDDVNPFIYYYAAAYTISTRKWSTAKNPSYSEEWRKALLIVPGD